MCAAERSGETGKGVGPMCVGWPKYWARERAGPSGLAQVLGLGTGLLLLGLGPSTGTGPKENGFGPSGPGQKYFGPGTGWAWERKGSGWELPLSKGQ